MLKDNNSNELLNVLKKLTSSSRLRKKLQDKYYISNNFDIKIVSQLIDKIRYNFLNKLPNNLKKKQIKILHIANFNELSDGRLFYSFANKLNNGFIKNNHTVQIISDRNYLKYNKNLLNPYGNQKGLNNKILDTIKNFAPDVVLFGHVYTIDQKIFNYCKSNNIVTSNWFIDSISKEFLNGKKKQNYFNLVKNVDRSFLTSSPEIFKKYNFIKNSTLYLILLINLLTILEIMMNQILSMTFFAISHGQNRAILKKGKTDEREDAFNYLIKKLNKYKVGAFGINNVEPIWGSNFFYHLSKSKIGLNISRGDYQKLYSSDRISSLIGNGLLVFLERKTKLNTMFKDKKEVIFFNNKEDLLKKIIYYLENDKIRRKNCK